MGQTSPASPCAALLVLVLAVAAARGQGQEEVVVAAPSAAPPAAVAKPKGLGVAGSNTLFTGAHAGNFALCMCAKCGSTSILWWFFKAIRGHEFQRKTTGFIHLPNNPQWNGTFVSVPNKTEAFLDPQRLTIAFIRDPKKRLLSSWRSKLACDEEGFKTDGGRAKKTQVLLRLSGLLAPPPTKQCLSLHEFLEALVRVHRSHKSFRLDSHFKPQIPGACFREHAVGAWDHVVNLENEAVANATMKEAFLRLGHAEPPFPINRRHVSLLNTTHEQQPLTPEIEEMLDYVTQAEYAALRPHL